MNRISANAIQIQTKEAEEKLNAALLILRQDGNTVPIDRARAIAACASQIVESVKIEARLLATKGDMQ